MITVKDVARKAGVPENTAIRALAGKIMGKRRDARERMERVLKAASELGYRPCEFAKSLRKGKTNTIGLVVGSITNRYFSALVEIVMDEAERNGYRMILELTRWDAEKNNQCLEHLLRLRVDGIFWSGGEFPEEWPLLDDVRDLDVPTIMLYHNDSGIPAVCRDHSDAMRKAVAYLVKQQCRNIVLAAWSGGSANNKIISDDFDFACRAAGAVPEVFLLSDLSDMDVLATKKADAILCDAPYCLKYYLSRHVPDPQRHIIGIYDRWNWVEHPEGLSGVILLDAEMQIRLAVRKLIAAIENRSDDLPDIQKSEFFPQKKFSQLSADDLTLSHLFPY